MWAVVYALYQVFDHSLELTVVQIKPGTSMLYFVPGTATYTPGVLVYDFG